MPYDRSPFRKFYATLVRLYPKTYRTRFGEGMEQTFNDLYLEHASAGAGLYTFTISAFADTALGILKENFLTLTSLFMKKSILQLAIAVGLFMLIPLWGSMNVEGWNWTSFDFAIAYSVIFVFGLTFILIARKANNNMYKYALGLALATAFVLLWINAAVGLIGDGDIPNALYLVVFAIGFFGAIATRFKPAGMSRVVFATALAQFLVPVVAYFIWPPQGNDWSPGIVQVFMLNAFFTLLFAGSGLLFRQSAEQKIA